MPNPQWPSPLFGGGTLPDSVLTGAQRGTLVEGKVSSDVDSGPPQVRKVFTAIPETLSFDLNLDSDAKARELLTFHDTTLAMGSLPFDWELPEDPGNTVVFIFLARPELTFADLGPIWRARVQLRTVPA